MAKFYTKNYTHKLFISSLLFLQFSALATNSGGPDDPVADSTASKLGHCITFIVADTNCLTQDVTLAAYVQFTFSGIKAMVTATWNTGEFAHKINVVPPGTWSWDPVPTGCEPGHWFNEITFDSPFFNDSIDISGPTVICPFDPPFDLTLNTNGYSDFSSYTWNPVNQNGGLEPYTVFTQGTYSLTVTDAFGCSSSDHITVTSIPTFVPPITGPTRMCPEGDTATLALTTPNLYSGYEWSTGETTNPIVINEPGVYMVTATEPHGCTGVNTFSVLSGEVNPFNVTLSTPALCPGQVDTINATTGFSHYDWSNGASGFTNIVNQPGTYTVTVTNIFGCTATSSVTIAPLFPPVIQVTSTPLCPGGSSSLTAVGGNFPNYSWSSGQSTPTITTSAPGTYSVTVSGPGVCATSTNLVLNFAAAPTTTIAPPASLNCITTQATLNGSGSSAGPNFPLQWSTQGGHFVSGDTTLNPVVDLPGTYILSITNTLTGCVTNDTVVVTRDITTPPANAGPPATLTCAVQNLVIGPVPAPNDPNLLPVWTSPGGFNITGDSTWAPGINQPGTYILTVTNASNGCTNTASVVIPQDIVVPTAIVAPPNLLTCTQGTVPLDGSGSSTGPGFTYLWTTANGLLVGPANSINSTAGSIGTYTLLVTNTVNGCTQTTSVTVAADINIPNVSALTPNILTCSVLNTLIDASGSSSGANFLYNWTTATGNIVSGGNTLTPTVSAPGIYTLNLLNTANQCTATLAVTVNQNIIPPLANAGQDASLNCTNPSMVLDGSASSTGANFTYNWTTTTGNIVSGNGTLNPTVNTVGTYVLQVTDLTNGCTASSSVTVMNDVNAPNALIAAPAVLTCTTQQTVIDASASTQTGNLTYLWSGNILSGQGTLQPAVNQPGVYSLSITNNTNGCTDVASVTVTQDIVPPAALAGPDPLINCFNPTGSIGSLANPSGAGFTLLWTTANGHFITPVNGQTATVDQAGTYHLLVTNTQNGCTATDDVTVAADFSAPAASAGPTAELNCVQTSVVLQGSGSSGSNISFAWTTGNGHIVSGANGASPVVDKPGLYTLLVTDTNNGCTATSQVTITENANGPVALAGLPQTLTCTFTSTQLSAAGSSTGAAFTYAWSTGNGNITAGANTFTPAIDAPGTYIVTVTNTTNLCTQTASVTILENVQNPVVNAGLDNTLTCVVTSLPLSAQIISSSSPNIGYQWSTTNGQIVSGGNTAGPVIDAPGMYSVTVTDGINGCTGTDLLQIAEDVTLPVAVIASPQTLTCALQQTGLNATASSAGANFAYQWTTPTGNFVSLQNQQQPVVDAPGVYNLVITNNINGCTQTASVTVAEDVQLPNVDAGATVGLDCDTQTNTLDATGSDQGSGLVYTWTTTSGQIISGANTLTPVIGDPGVYVLTVLNTQNGCSATDPVTVTEDVVHPVLAIAPPQILTCVVLSVPLNGSGSNFGNAPGITWATANGHITAGSNSLNATVDAPGAYTLTVLNTVNGCSTTVPVTVTENIQIPPLQVQPAPLLTCSVLQFPLSSTVPAQTTIGWTTADGHIVSGANTPNPTVDQPGLYQIAITSTVTGCTNTAQIPVLRELNVPTGLTFDLEPPLCNGTPGMLTVSQINGGIGPFMYSINGGQTFFPAQAFNTMQPGNYDLVIQDVNGCEITEPVVVPSPPVPVVTAPPLFEIELGENQQILAVVPPPFPFALVDTVIWSPTDGLTFEGNSIAQLLSPIAQPFRTTDYTVTIVTKEGCKALARTRIKVDREVDIYVPNVIWPEDPDGENGTFLIFARDRSIDNIKHLEIFDRWGTLIFENKDFKPNDPTAGWSGEYRGSPVNPAVFVWWAEVVLVDGRSVLLKGDVTVVR